MKKLPLALAALLATACSEKGAAPTATATPAAPLPPPIDKTTPLPITLPPVTARVNGREIKLLIVDLLAKKLLESAGNLPADRPFAYRRANQQMIVRELLLDEAVARKVMADDAKVEQAYNEARVPYKDDRAWIEFLASQGMDPDTFRTEVRAQQTIAALLGRIRAEVPDAASDDEAKAFFDQNPAMFESGERLRARHLLLRIPGDATPKQKDLMRSKTEGLLARLKKGEDFAGLAKQFSQDPGSAARGGELEVFKRGQMVPAFDAAAFALKPGELSGVVESPFGFHIIRLEERLPSQKLPYEGIKDRLKRVLVEKRKDERVEKLIGALWGRARIETYL